jgi:Zn-finger nucleic acid-binding protein
MVYRESNWLCPRCGTALEDLDAMGNRFLTCAQCRGAFVDPSTLARMFAEMGGATPQATPIDAARALPCPGCAQPMARARLTHAEGAVEVDTCGKDGMWFDTRELEQTLEAVGLAALEIKRA